MGLEQTIRTELDGNPGVYAALTDLQAADYMNDPANDSVDVSTITNTQLYEATTNSDRAIVEADATKKASYEELLGLDEIAILPGSRGRANLVAMFLGTTTGTNIVALLTEPASRASIIGIGTVAEGGVQRARDLP